jgi:hypothetical protein
MSTEAFFRVPTVRVLKDRGRGLLDRRQVRFELSGNGLASKDAMDADSRRADDRGRQA